MRTDDGIPMVAQGSSLTAALLEISRKRMGMTAVVDETKKVLGILTDGDVRRLFEKGVDVRTLTIDDAMHHSPHTISPDVLAVSAVQLLDTHHINQVLVTDEHGTLVGALNVHDLFAAKVM
jgi:arabinose-5-phosphate isomerase